MLRSYVVYRVTSGHRVPMVKNLPASSSAHAERHARRIYGRTATGWHLVAARPS